MEYAAIGTGLGACLLILVQDLRARWVHVVPLVLLLASGLVFRRLHDGAETWPGFGANVMFVVVILAVVALYFRLKDGGKFLDEKLGLGDVVMLFAVAAWLDPLGFVLYYVSGMLVILAGVSLFLAVKGVGKEYPVPLAGLLAGYLAVFGPVYYVWRWEIWGMMGMV
ncbi:MAG: hypothetical protein AAF570_02715 [Bacteroidota bacterium]